MLSCRKILSLFIIKSLLFLETTCVFMCPRTCERILETKCHCDNFTFFYKANQRYGHELVIRRRSPFSSTHELSTFGLNFSDISVIGLRVNYSGKIVDVLRAVTIKNLSALYIDEFLNPESLEDLDEFLIKRLVIQYCNNLYKIPREGFGLKSLRIFQNHIEAFPVDFFQNLNYIEEISVENNKKLKLLPVLDSLSQLQRFEWVKNGEACQSCQIHLNETIFQNQINLTSFKFVASGSVGDSIHQSTFKNNKKLTEISISNAQIVPNHDFQFIANLDTLKVINLSNAYMRSLRLNNIPASVEEIRLGTGKENNFHCNDCLTVSNLAELKRRGLLKNVVSIACHNTYLSLSVTLEKFCQNSITTKTAFFIFVPLSALLVIIGVSLIVYITKRKSKLALNFDDENAEFDVFLSCADEDQEFAQDLLEVLRKRGHYTVLSNADFQEGESIPELIQNAVEKCRITCIILSHCYLQSPFSDMDARASGNRRRKILIVTRSSLNRDSSSLDNFPILKKIIGSVACVQENDPNFESKILAAISGGRNIFDTRNIKSVLHLFDNTRAVENDIELF